MKYRFNALKTASNAARVATYDEDGNLLALDSENRAPRKFVIEPDNSAGVATVNLSTGYVDGDRILIQDVHGATANSITVTPLGSFVDTAGSAVGQVVIDTDDGFAILEIANGLTVLAAYKGADLTP